MNIATVNLTNTFIPTSSVFVWLKAGWSLFISAPIKLFLLLIAFMVVGGLFQLLPAPWGIVLSKWIGAGVMALIWPVVYALSITGKFSIKAIAAHNAWGRLSILSLILLIPTCIQLLCAYLMLGTSGLHFFIGGEMIDVTAIQVGVIFASAAPVLVLLTFVPALLLLQDKSVMASVTMGINLTIQAWRPMFILMLITALMLFLAPLTVMLSALVIGPILVCVNYKAYEHLMANTKDTM